MKDDLLAIKAELERLFPNAKEKIKETKDASGHIFLISLEKGKAVALKVSQDYLENHSEPDIVKHLRRNIFHVIRSNMNKTVLLLKNFEIEIEEPIDEIAFA